MPDGDAITLPPERIRALCVAASLRAGFAPEAAQALAEATVAAEAEGQPGVGLLHFFDYLAAASAGRIDGQAVPCLTRPAPALLAVDARGGLAQLGFDMAFGDLVDTARRLGVAVFVQRNAYTCGALGHFTLRLARAGLVALAAANGPPMLTGAATGRAIFGTNPLAFAAPLGDGEPLLIDQASSATAFVKIRGAAERGETIPPGWAVGPDGTPTTDPVAAMQGALLPFGGARGGNIALMVEVLAAGLTGANWSLDAPSFSEGTENPGVGLFVLAIAPGVAAPAFAGRLAAQTDRLAAAGVHIPGPAKAARRERAARSGIAVPRPVHDRLMQAAGAG